MGIGELTQNSAIEQALAEFDLVGRDAFLASHGFGKSRDYFVISNDQLYDAKAIAGVAYGYQHPDRGNLSHNDFSGGVNGANSALEKLGYTIIRCQTTSADDERAWRFAIWNHLQRTGNVDRLTPGQLHSHRAYYGGRGIWFDLNRTWQIDKTNPCGVTVAVLHTGVHYPDELSDAGLIYHYPRTDRPGRDESEVAATKAAAVLRIPIFVITKPSPKSKYRAARIAWVDGWDDASATFLIAYRGDAPQGLLVEDNSDSLPFVLEGSRSRRVKRTVKHRPDQQRFKFEVTLRYGNGCALSNVKVPEMIEAAHLMADAAGGTSDPRNGLLLNAALHKAFDAYLFAIDPDTLNVLVRPNGPSMAEMGITKSHIRDLPRKPHPEALKWRYEKWLSMI